MSVTGGDNIIVVACFMAICFLAGGLLAAAGVVVLLLYRRKKLRCRLPVKGTVVDLEWDEGNTRPHFSYTYAGREYEAVSSNSTSLPLYKAGDTIDIYIDETHPEVYLIPGDGTTQKVAGIILLVLGCLHIIAGAGICVFLCLDGMGCIS